MKIKLKTILIIIAICLCLLYIIYKVDTYNEAKNRVEEIGQQVINLSSSNDYEGLRKILKKTNGKELTDDEITNFLINTKLYRTKFVDEDNREYSFNISLNLFNVRKGNILIFFKPLNGQVISNNLKYERTGAVEYLIAEKIEEPDLERKSSYIKLDLEDGTLIEVNDEHKSNSVHVFEMKRVSDDKAELSILKDEKEEYKIYLKNEMNKAANKLYKNAQECSFNEDYTAIKVYMRQDDYKEIEQNPAKFYNAYKLQIWYQSMILQSLEGNEDWHFKLELYDYDTNELVKTEIIR